MVSFITKPLGRLLERIAGADRQLHDLLHGTAVSLVLKTAAIGFGFLFYVVVARLLGVEESGIFHLAMTIAGLAATIGRAGMDSLLVRLVASHAAKNEWTRVRDAFRASMKYSLFGSGIAAIALFSLSPILSSNVFSKQEVVVPLQILAISVPFLAILFVSSSALRGLGRMLDFNLTNGQMGLLTRVLLVIAALILGRSFGIHGIAVGFTAAVALTAVFSLYRWRQAIAKHPGNDSKHRLAPSILSSGIPLLWVALSEALITIIPTIFLGVYGSATELGLFNAAWRTTGIATAAVLAVHSISAPKFAALYATGNLPVLINLAKRAALTATVISAPLLALLMLAPAWVLSWFGPGFTAASSLLVVLSFAQLANAAMGSAYYVLLGSGREKLLRNMHMLLTMISIVLAAVLVPFAGALGAAVSAAIVIVGRNIACVACCSRLVSLRASMV